MISYMALMFVVVIMKFFFNKTHFLMSLLSLELLGLMMYMLLNLTGFNLGFEGYCGLYYLVMLVGESILGLSLLVVTLFSHSMDYMSMMNFMLC